jgi:L-threonylcarbamoyladenylate synthase
VRRVPFVTRRDVTAAISEVSAHLKSNGLIAYPTETVYGFGGLVTDEALTSLSVLKSRDESKPFLLLIRDAGGVPELEWTPAARKLASHFWPGALTLAMRVHGAFPSRILSAEGTVAVRATPHEGIRSLLEVLGQPLTSTSANLPRSAPATSAEEVERVLQEMERDDVVILDGGVIPDSPPSTLVDAALHARRLLR